MAGVGAAGFARAGRRSARLATVLVTVVALVTLGACTSGTREAAAAPVRITVASGRPQMVTGGDTLVRVQARGRVRFLLDGHDVTGRTRTAHDGATVLALVRGMKAGTHRITAVAGSKRATVRVRDFPITGPVFSGPHLPLPVCTTAQLGLGKATDANCSAPTTTTWQYRTTAGAFRPLTVPGPRPADMQTVTVDGRRVDEIVRVEEGVINRAVYWIGILDPDVLGTNGVTTGPSFDDRGWNHRLVYRYGGGCGTSYSQGTQLGTTVIDDGLLSRGYAIATATFNTFQVQCNDVLSAETTMMVKEHFAEGYGPPRFMIGDGASGGAIQQLLIAQDYPGLLDAIAPTLPFPDAISISGGVSDCGLLTRYFASPSGSGWSTAQQAAVEGHRTVGTCGLWVSSFLGNVVATTGCDPRIPRSEIYDPVTNRRGLRCTLQDSNRNELGVDRETGFARRPLDNVGVQYGLEALRAHVITVDQFLDLNEKVGGYDIDGNPVAEREVARAADVRRAFRDGRVLEGGNVRSIPVITTNVYTDAQGDIHDRYRVFEIRDRLRGADGAVDPNQLVWTVPPGSSLGASATGAVAGSATLVGVLDEWLTTGQRPAAAVDTCTLPDGRRITGAGVNEHDPSCIAAYPSFGDPRTAAGGPVRGDVVKCRLAPIDEADYGTSLGPAQLDRLRRIFPTGVCDWTRRSVGFATPRTWVDYGH